MKKMIKRLFGVVLAILCIQIVHVKAISVDEEKQGTIDTDSLYVTNTGMLAVTNINEGDSFKAYKLVEAYYNESTNTITYEFTDLMKMFLEDNPEYYFEPEEGFNISSGNIYNGSVTSNSGADFGASIVANWIRSNHLESHGIDMEYYHYENEFMDEVNAAYIDDTEIGTYLILPTTASKVYAVMIGNVELYGNEDNCYDESNVCDTYWDIKDGIIVAKSSDVGISAYLSDNQTNEGVYGHGDTVNYNFVVTLPTYPTNATNNIIKIKGQIDEHLLIDIDTAYLRNGEFDVTRILNRILFDEQNQISGYIFNLLIDGENVGLATLLTNGSYEFEFDYDLLPSNILTFTGDFMVNDTLLVGEPGTYISAYVEFADPYGEGTFTSEEAYVNIYTAGLRIYSHNDNYQGINGAIFEIYSDSEFTDLVGTIEVDEYGYGELDGLHPGTYYIKQVRAADGKKLDNNVFSVYVEFEPNSDDDYVNVEVDEPNDGYTVIDVLNETIESMPSTGGIGTYIFTFTGMSLILVSFLILFSKKKNEKGN